MKNGQSVTSIKRFSVYWFDPDPGRGSELQKIRPGVVISPNEMNDLLKTVLIIPLTTTVIRWPFRVPIEIMGHKSNIACDQLRAIDKSRLKDNILSLTPKQQESLLSVLRVIIAA
jgi:mRNA interferase MazF